MSMDTTENILETIRMIEEQNLDIRTVTMGISLLGVSIVMVTGAARKSTIL